VIHRKSLGFVGAAAAVLTVLFGCATPPPTARPAQDSPPAATAEQHVRPTTPEEAEALKQRGQTWSNEEIRAYYLELAGSVDASNERGCRRDCPPSSAHGARMTSATTRASPPGP
jgi:hypothetical protein